MPILRARRSSQIAFRVAAASQPFAVPLAVTEFASSPSNRLSFDLGGYSLIRLTLRVNAVADAGSFFKAQYAPLDESTWNDVCDPVAVDVANLRIGAWAAIPTAAKTTVNLRLVGYGGAGSISANFANIFLEVK